MTTLAPPRWCYVSLGMVQNEILAKQ